MTYKGLVKVGLIPLIYLFSFSTATYGDALSWSNYPAVKDMRLSEDVDPISAGQRDSLKKQLVGSWVSLQPKKQFFAFLDGDTGFAYQKVIRYKILGTRSANTAEVLEQANTFLAALAVALSPDASKGVKREILGRRNKSVEKIQRIAMSAQERGETELVRVRILYHYFDQIYRAEHRGGINFILAGNQMYPDVARMTYHRLVDAQGDLAKQRPRLYSQLNSHIDGEASRLKRLCANLVNQDEVHNVCEGYRKRIPDLRDNVLKVSGKSAVQTDDTRANSEHVTVPDRTVTAGINTPTVNVEGCWQWSNGARIHFLPDGSVVNGSVRSSWQTTANPNIVTVAWPAIEESIRLSSDGSSFSGQGAFKMPVSGSRVEAGSGLTGRWTRPDGLHLYIRSDGTVDGGHLQGTWIHKGGDDYQVLWPVVDEITLSADGTALVVRNQFAEATAQRTPESCDQ